MLLPMGFNVASKSYKTIVREEGDGDIFACFIHKKLGVFDVNVNMIVVAGGFYKWFLFCCSDMLMINGTIMLQSCSL